jgi:Restriction Enzyme Adenine Methylase Associated
MPLYEIRGNGELAPFRLLRGGADLYEKEIEELAWENPDEFLGESLLLVARQQPLPDGGRPDIIGLSKDARVVVVEIKRDIERRQLAQCLEYAGWARTTSLDELAGMYHGGAEAFFRDWQEFTEASVPQVVNRNPKIVLVARTFHGRTESALDFLLENGVPISVIEVALYEDNQQRRFLDITGEHEPELPPRPPDEIDITRIEGRRVRLSDLIEAELLNYGDDLVWHRPRLGTTYRAKVGELGGIILEDGREFASPSVAAVRAADLPAYDGWYAWRVEQRGGETLNELRKELALRRTTSDGASDSPDAA